MTDVFSAIADVKPGTIPLLVRMPDGNCEQMEVPLHSTVDDITNSLQKNNSSSSDVYRLSFGNTDLDPAASLLDTNIVDAYEHAGSLLNVIGAGSQDAETKALALDSACAVVESISNGIKDMEALCAAAMHHDSYTAVPASPRTAHLVAEGAAEDHRETPKHFDADEFKLLNNMISKPHPNPANAQPDSVEQRAADPTQLVRNLSRRLPNLFPRPDPNADPNDPNPHPPQSRLPTAAPEFQPSISSIRDARRRFKENTKNDPPQETPPDPAADLIGTSTNVGPLPELDPLRESHRDRHLMLANSGKSTWLEDVMTTWEVGVVRQSGVLETSKDGQELNEYFHGLEDEAQRDRAIAQANADTPSNNHPQPDHNPTEGSTHIRPPNGTLPPTTSTQNGDSKANDENGTDDVRKSMATFAISNPSDNPASQMAKAQNAASVAIANSPAQPLQASASNRSTGPSPGANSNTSPKDSVNPQSSQSQPSAGQTQIQRPSAHPQQKIASQPSSIVSRGATQSATSARSSEESGSSASTRNGRSPPPLLQRRQATKIAPAPTTPGIPGANMYGNQMYPGVVPVPGVTWPPRATPPGPKKRGRKRKNPELTDEERALVRKEQNRESAKLSRVRRKVIAAEYEGRLSALVGENTMLRKQVEGLNNRLVYLQSLLTVSVRQESS